MHVKGFLVGEKGFRNEFGNLLRLVKTAAGYPQPATRKKTGRWYLYEGQGAASRQRLFTAFNGFTLLELMVAIVLFSMISAAAHKLFTSVTRAQAVTQSVLDDLDKLQRAEMVLEKDLFQMARRPVRDENGRQQPALKAPGNGGALLEFTRSGWQNPLQATRSTLQRVAYAVEGNQLIRYYWPMLDRAPGDNPIRQPVMSGVSSAKFRFLDQHKRWITIWPTMNRFQQGTSDDSLAQLPAAVELTIVHEKMGSMVTVVPLISYKPDQADQEGRPVQDNISYESGS